MLKFQVDCACLQRGKASANLGEKVEYKTYKERKKKEENKYFLFCDATDYGEIKMNI